MLRTTMMSVGAGLVLGLAACGGEEQRPAAATARTTGDAARYCALAEELDSAGTEFFADLEADETAGRRDYEKAERDFVARYAPQFAEIEAAAPEAVRADVRTMLTAQRERAGLATKRTSRDAVARAERAVKAFERRNCAA